MKSKTGGRETERKEQGEGGSKPGCESGWKGREGTGRRQVNIKNRMGRGRGREGIEEGNRRIHKKSEEVSCGNAYKTPHRNCGRKHRRDTGRLGR